ncbi:MAG TPA: FGGY family carbohydrate kinase, partial [Thermomicrobiales bacterium]|nr:FGGY family carbohydrate kinase [Thermomicrobiales bacterium]
MAGDAILAIDLGTSSVKTLVLDQHGRVAGRGQASYPTLHPRPLHDEQHLDDWIEATVSAAASARRFAPHLTIRAIAVTGQMHGTVLFDRADQPVGPAIIWSDRRAAADIDGLAGSLGADLHGRI